MAAEWLDAVQDGTWHHIAEVDGVLYIDGLPWTKKQEEEEQ